MDASSAYIVSVKVYATVSISCSFASNFTLTKAREFVPFLPYRELSEGAESGVTAYKT